MAVITNILKGALGIDRSDIQYMLPELDYDETDLARMRIEQFSNWTVVKSRCENGELIQHFFEAIDDQRFIVIHIDTAERLETGFDVTEPKKEDVEGYVQDIRGAVVLKLKEWLGENIEERIAFAIAVEEVEAWVIAIFDDRILETGFLPRPKEKLISILNRPNLITDRDRKRLFQMNEFDKFLELSRHFRKVKHLQDCAERNESLKVFCNDLEKFSN